MDDLPKMTEKERSAIRDHMRSTFSSTASEEGISPPDVIAEPPPGAQPPQQTPPTGRDPGEPAVDWA
jgi:hypothetical protein